MPQSPSTTLGIAASNSTSEPTIAAHATRRELAEVEADGDGERGREHERDERGHRRAVDERQRAEDLLDRIPGRGP